MDSRIEDKIKDIERFLDEIAPVIPGSFEKYMGDYKIKAVCERYFEKIVEATVDLAFLIRKGEGFKIPEEDGEMFLILAENNIISVELAKRLKDAKGMRNIIAHEYGDEIDDKKVFNAINEELEKDIREFLNSIKQS